MSDPIAPLRSGAQVILDRALTEIETGRFSKYLGLLLEWQRVHRLVGSTDPEWIVATLFLDSLLFLRVLPLTFRSLLDVGSGAGLPGIPIKIARPEAEVTLLESRRRRVSFLRATVRELGLEGVAIVDERLEDFVRRSGGGFDAVVMRSAGSYDRLVSLARPLVSPGGLIVVSGPPTRRPIPGGRWIEVAGAGRSRLFAVTEVG